MTYNKYKPMFIQIYNPIKCLCRIYSGMRPSLWLHKHYHITNMMLCHQHARWCQVYGLYLFNTHIHQNVVSKRNRKITRIGFDSVVYAVVLLEIIAFSCWCISEESFDRIWFFLTALLGEEKYTCTRHKVEFSWASYQIRNIGGCACTANAGSVFPAAAG